MKITQFINTKKTFVLFAFLTAGLCIQATNYYVATTGNDSGNGSLNTPWKTIQKAAATAGAGDHVYIKKGTYSNIVNIGKSGTSAAWLTYDAYPGDELQVIVNGGSINIIGKKYVRISGIKVQNAKNGFYVQGPNCSNIEISKNHTYNTTASGIVVWGVAYGQNPGTYNNIQNIVIKNNKVQKACNGGYNECITVANGIVGFEISGNEIYDGGNPINGGEGIDLKEGVKDGVIAYNNIHNLTRRGIYIDAGGLLNFTNPSVTNVKVYGNISRNNVGAGMAIMTEGKGDVYNINIYNNLFYNNTEDGIMFYKHPAGTGSVHDITIVNNTLYGNARNGMTLNFTGAYNMKFRNNIAYNNTAQNFQFLSGNYIQTNNLVGVDPKFINANGGNFRLLSNSPAINFGTTTDAPLKDYDGKSRVGNVDAGAFEFLGTSTRSSIISKTDENEITTDKVSIYPNPASSYLNVITSTNEVGTSKLSAYNLNGKKVIEQDIINKKINAVDVSMLPEGVYLFKTGNDTKTIIINKK